MPIFELDEGRPVLVQPMQPAAASFGADSAALVADELGSLLGEQLFPVRPRPAGGADAPHLLALDAVGQPVVVEVVQVLDGEALVRALRYAGVAARLSPGDLARAYHGGTDRFSADFAAFRETVPVVATLGATGLGSRLLLVCADVDESVADAVAFLRRPGRQVEVLQIGVVRGVDGRRYVDVSPLVQHVPARRQVEPASLRLVHSSDAFAAAMAYDASRQRRPTRSEPTPPAGMPASDLSRPDYQPAASTVPASPAAYLPPTAYGAAVPPSAALSGPLPAASGYHAATSTHPAGYPSGHVSTPTRRADHPTTPSSPLRASAVTAAAAAPLPVASAGPSARPVPEEYAAPEDYSAPARPDDAPAPSAHHPGDVDPALAALAAGYQAPATLVWFRQRRGQRLVAMLRTDGLVQLPDGNLFADPDEAAARAAGAEVPVDGWGAWRLGDGGPTLAEATGRA